MIARINRLSSAQAWFIIAIAGALSFTSGIGNPFDGNDDQVQIVNNVPVHSIGNIALFFQGSTLYAGHGSTVLIGNYYRPLMTTVFSLLYTVFGANPIPFHVAQQGFCIASAGILYLVFRRCSFQPLLALLLSLVFLVHPIDSEAAFSIPYMQDALFFFFGILGLWCLTRFDSVRSLIGVTACLVLSLFSKETGIVFAVMALLYLFWWDRRRLYPFMGIMVLPAIAWFLLRVNAVGLFSNPHFTLMNGLDYAPIDVTSLPGRLLTAPSVVFLYLSKLVWPMHQASAYYWVHSTFSFQDVVLPLLIDIAVGAAVVYVGIAIRKRGTVAQRKTYWFFAVWTALGLLVYLQLIPLDATANEVWFRFSMAGILGMIGLAITTFAPLIRLDYRSVVGMGSIVVVLLGVTTALRGTVWGNASALASQDIQNSPDDYVAEFQLAALESAKGDTVDALMHARQSVAFYSDGENNYLLANIYARTGDYCAALHADTAALKYQNLQVIVDNRAPLTVICGAPAANKQFLLNDVDRYPEDPIPWFYLAYVEYRQNDAVDAQDAVSQAHKYAPTNQTISAVYDRIMNGLPVTITYSG